MSWRHPKNLFGPRVDDRLMMQEILELLATNSPNSNQTPTKSGSADNTPCKEEPSNYHEDKSMSKRLSDIVTLSSAKSETGEEAQKQVSEKGKRESKDERIASFGKRGQQEAQQMHDSIPNSPMPLDDYTALRRSSLSSTPSRAGAHPYFEENPHIVSDAFARPPSTACSLPVAVPVETKTSSSSKDSSTKSSSNSTVLPTGQRVHVMDSAEFDELRRKLRMQTASRRYRKRKKEQYRQQKMQIQELQAELAHLQEVEAQWKQYTQRSEESLEKELETHKKDIVRLEKKIQEAQEEEVEWVKMMSTQSLKQ